MNEQIINFINDNLSIDIEKKNRLGEVFTPIDLVNKVLDLLPVSVWKNPDYKWLDPCAGVGNFLLVVYMRLMGSLENWEPNETKRSNHIIQNMLYFCEIDKANSALIKKIVSKIANKKANKKAKVNLLVGDFLSDSKQNNSFLENGFDIIVGNPPFQDDPMLDTNDNNKRIIGHKSKLYERILDKCLDILLVGGHITFITPNNLFAGNSSAVYKRIVTDNSLLVSSVIFEKKPFPKVQQQFCYFLIDKTNKPNKTNKTNINNELTTVLLDRPINPVMDWTTKTEALVRKYLLPSGSKNNAKYNRGKSVGDYVGNKYKLIYKPNGETLGTNSAELAVGLGIKKIVIFAISTDLEFITDFKGEYGVGPNTFYIPVNNVIEGRKLASFLLSNEYKELALACKTTRQFLKIGFIEHLNIKKIVSTNRVTNKAANRSTNKAANKSRKVKTK